MNLEKDVERGWIFVRWMVIITLLLAIGSIVYQQVKTSSHKSRLSDQTLNDICYSLDNQSVDFKITHEGKLICIRPTYDHTKNIIITEGAT